MADDLVAAINATLAEHADGEEAKIVEVAESAVALAEAQTALANVQAAQTVAESKSEIDKLWECTECLTRENQELRTEIQRIRSEFEESKSSIPQPIVVTPPPPEPVKVVENLPQVENLPPPSLKSADESPAPKTAPRKRAVRRI